MPRYLRQSRDEEDDKINAGDHYYISGFTTMAAEGVYYVKLVTPDTGTLAHFTWRIESNGILTTYFYEGVSGGMADGGDVTPLNNNRNSSNTSVLTITGNVTVATDLGTTIEQKKVGGEGFKSVFGGSADRGSKIILKQNTIYLRKFLSDTAANIVSFRASWFEQSGG